MNILFFNRVKPEQIYVLCLDLGLSLSLSLYLYLVTSFLFLLYDRIPRRELKKMTFRMKRVFGKTRKT